MKENIKEYEKSQEINNNKRKAKNSSMQRKRQKVEKNKNEDSRSEKLKRKQENDSSKARMSKAKSSDKCFWEVRDDKYGKHMIMPVVPDTILFMLIISFLGDGYKEFIKNEKSIDSGNRSKKAAVYQMLENAGNDVGKNNWEHYRMPLHYRLTVDGIVTFMQNAAKDFYKTKTGNDAAYNYTRFGIVKTITNHHQELHIDTKEYTNRNGEYDWLVCHIPLMEEGMWLRRGKYNLENGTLHHKVQHVPFGTAIILPWGEFHAGNYGKKTTQDCIL